MNELNKTEKEKAAEGLLYDNNNDPQLVRERLYCKSLCFDYNQLSPLKLNEREELIRKIVARADGPFLIEQPFYCDQGYNIELGRNFFANHNLIILDAATVKFGENVFIGPNCGFYTAGHPLDVEQRNQGLEYAYPITVGDNVWFGGNVVVLPGVTIGSGSVIGAGSVVNRDIPPGVVAAGNPCRVIREITEEDRNRYKRN